MASFIASDVPQSMSGYRSPKTDLPKVYHEIILELRDELKKVGVIDRVEYVGSAFKGTRIDDSDMDNLFVKRDFSITDKPSLGGYAFLYDRQSGRIVPATTRQKFKGKVQVVINSMGYSNRVVLADNGPAIELRYCADGHRFSVDLVFCYEISDTAMYIAKPPKDATWDQNYLWKFSTALQEKRRMSIIDRDNKVARWAVRFMKALIKSEPTFHVLTSYVIEQALCHLRDTEPDYFWVESNLKQIIALIMTFLAYAVEQNHLANKFNSAENVMPTMSATTRSNVVNRLRRLSRDPHLQRILDTV